MLLHAGLVRSFKVASSPGALRGPCVGRSISKYVNCELFQTSFQRPSIAENCRYSSCRLLEPLMHHMANFACNHSSYPAYYLANAITLKWNGADSTIIKPWSPFDTMLLLAAQSLRVPTPSMRSQRRQRRQLIPAGTLMRSLYRGAASLRVAIIGFQHSLRAMKVPEDRQVGLANAKSIQKGPDGSAVGALYLLSTAKA
eukprot:6178749-Pleurochrysis_carterae.AAC.2